MVGLRDQQVVGFDAEFLRVAQVERVLGIDICTHTALLLCFRNDLQRQGGLAG